MTSNLSKVFVYGTLKKCEPNHNWMTNEENGHSTFISNAKTITKYPLIIATKYNIPFLLDCPGKGHIVEGELYSIDNNMLSKLDVLEEHPTFYTRRLDDVITSGGGTESCWIYFLKNFREELLGKEMYPSYSSTGSHNLPYCERYLRTDGHDFKSEIVSVTRQPKA